ncbi:hypothetical protein GCM10010411_20420 [Actinomadura fulvescens]|uniref:Uncharacterized protein n=1 Tax=Actinomadura fulvescens TaxID=46160 RepID=A0ABN3PJL3_9ACTN
MEALLWEAHEHPLPDVDAVGKTIAAIRAAQDGEPEQITSQDLGAALLVLQAARLDLDRLEVELIEAVRDAGLDWAAIAAVLGLPDAGAAEQRYEALRPRTEAPTDHVLPLDLGRSPPATPARRPPEGA